MAITFWIIPIVTNPPEIPFVKIDPAKMVINVGYQYGFLRCLLGFVLGMMLYQGYKNEWGKAWLSKGYAFLLLSIGLFGAMHLHWADVLPVSFFPFLLLSAAYGSPRIDAFLQSKPLQKLGDWSFSIYMTHEVLLFTIGVVMGYLNKGKVVAAGPPPPPPDVATGWLLCFGVLALALSVSWLTYRFLEVPARYWINPKKR